MKIGKFMVILATVFFLTACGANETDTGTNPVQNSSEETMEGDVNADDTQELSEDSTSATEKEENTTEEVSDRELTAQELADYTQYLQQRDCYGFLLSSYDDVRKVDLEQVFYNGAGVSRQPEEKEITAYLQEVGQEELFTDLVCVSATDMDRLLQEKTGYSLKDMQDAGNTSDMIYLEEYDAYFHEAGDTNYVQVSCTSGTENEDGTITLECESGMGEGEDYSIVLQCTVTLDKETRQFIKNEIADGFYLEND